MSSSKYRFILITVMLALPVVSYGKCTSSLASLFKRSKGFEKDTTLTELDRITRIENFTNSLRTQRDAIDTALNIKIYKKIDKIYENIFNDAFTPNERTWRVFFREMETNLAAFRRYKTLKDFMERRPELSIEDFKAKVFQLNFSEDFQNYLFSQVAKANDIMSFKSLFDEEYKKILVSIGNDYQEYRMVLGSLEKLQGTKECSEICKSQIQRLLSSLGVASEKERLMNPIFLGGESRIPLEELRDSLYSEPLFVLTKAKKERNAELLNFIISFFPNLNFADNIFGLIYKSKIIGNTRAVKFFSLIYDAQARAFHFPKINKIIHSTLDTNKNLELLIILNDTIDADELLVTFARRIDALAQKKWKSLLEFAKANDKAFFEKMTTASKKASARGAISPTAQKSTTSRIATYLALGTVPALGYFYFDAPSASTLIPFSDEDSQSGLGGQTVTEVEIPPEELLELQGDTDSTLDEVSEVIENDTVAVERDPSSIGHFRQKYRSNFFEALWCSITKCSH